MTRPCALAGAVALAGLFITQTQAAPLLVQTDASPWSGYPNLPVVTDSDETAFGEEFPAANSSPTLPVVPSVANEEVNPPTVGGINELLDSGIGSNGDLDAAIVMADDTALSAGLAEIAASAAVEPTGVIAASVAPAAAAAIDEPSTLLLLGAGLSMVVMAMKKRQAVRR
jgi:hypothetical protein